MAKKKTLRTTTRGEENERERDLEGTWWWLFISSVTIRWFHKMCFSSSFDSFFLLSLCHGLLPSSSSSSTLLDVLSKRASEREDDEENFNSKMNTREREREPDMFSYTNYNAKEREKMMMILNEYERVVSPIIIKLLSQCSLLLQLLSRAPSLLRKVRGKKTFESLDWVWKRERERFLLFKALFGLAICQCTRPLTKTDDEEEEKRRRAEKNYIFQCHGMLWVKDIRTSRRMPCKLEWKGWFWIEIEAVVRFWKYLDIEFDFPNGFRSLWCAVASRASLLKNFIFCMFLSRANLSVKGSEK